ncbi:MAG: hypothetical protein ABJB10_09430 [Mesorhizobium sp.]
MSLLELQSALAGPLRWLQHVSDRELMAVEAAPDLGKRSFISEVVRAHYSPKIQMSPAQIQCIAGSILARGKDCNLLVFGCGYDSPLWAAINDAGFTIFMETDPEWADRVKGLSPGLNILLYAPVGTVASALRSVALADVPPPAALLERKWDVIVIDGPPGSKLDQPGRHLPISWTASIRQPSADVFVHDYERRLERIYTDRFIAPHGAPRVLIGRRDKDRTMLWSIGAADEFYTERMRPAPPRRSNMIKQLLRKLLG